MPGFIDSSKHPDGLSLPCCFAYGQRGNVLEKRKEIEDIDTIDADAGDEGGVGGGVGGDDDATSRTSK